MLLMPRSKRVAELLPEAPEMHALLFTAPDRLDTACAFSNVSVLHALPRERLRAARLRGGGAAAIVALLPPALPALALEHVRLEALGGAAELDATLALLTSLQSLELHSCRIRRAGATRLARRIAKLQGLTALSIRSMPCIDELTERLGSLTSLRALSLGAWLADRPWLRPVHDEQQLHSVAQHLGALQALTRLEVHTPLKAALTEAFLREASRLPSLAKLQLCAGVRAVQPFLASLRERGVVLRLRATIRPSEAISADEVAALGRDAGAVVELNARVQSAAGPHAKEGSDTRHECAALMSSLGALPSLTFPSVHVMTKPRFERSLAPWQASLARLTFLTALVLSELTRPSPAALQALGSALVQLTGLTHLALVDCAFEPHALAGQRVAALPLPTTLCSLVLNRIQWGACGNMLRGNVRALGRRLRALPQLSHLHFESPSSEALEEVTPHLPDVPALQHLHLCGSEADFTFMDTPRAASIAAVIRKLTSITRLTALTGVHCPGVGPCMAEAAAALPCIRALDVPRDCANEPALLQLAHLTEVRFEGELPCTFEHGCLLPMDAVLTVATGLPAGVPDEALVYTGVPEGAQTRASAAQPMQRIDAAAPQVEFVNLLNVGLDDRVLDALLPRFAELRAVHTVQLGSVQLAPEAALRLVAALVKLPALDKLRLVGVSVDGGGVAALFPFIAALTGLSELSLYRTCAAGEAQAFAAEYRPRLQWLQVFDGAQAVNVD
jgi:hypothetical protein